MHASARFRAAVIGVALTLSLVGSPAVAAGTLGTATQLTSTVTASSAKLSWTAAPNATSYSVCLKTSATATTCVRESTRSSATTTTFDKLAPTGGTDYYWTVRAYATGATTTSARASFDLVAKPAVPTGLKATPSTSSVAIAWSPAANATSYRVCLMASATSTGCVRLTSASSATTASFTGLTPQPGRDWYFRVHAYNGSLFSLSSRVGFDLKVGAVTGVAVSGVTTTSMKVSWAAATNASTYEVQWAKSIGMTIDFHSKVVSTKGTSLTNLTPGVLYYVKVRGLNDDAKGPLTAARSQQLPTAPFTTTVITYNLCGQDKCREPSKNAVLPTWSKRKPIAGAIARRANADVIATQESHDEDTRFITQLPGFAVASYKSAKTLFYRTARLSKLRSGTITLDSTHNRYAVWAEFRDRTTRTRFIVADPHLEPYKGKTKDDLRRAQTKKLIAAVKSANPEHLPVVYAGDFNSNKSNASYSGGYDAPEQVFQAAGIPDSYTTANDWLNKAYNSGSQAINPPIRHYDHIDHVYVDPKIKVGRWQTMTTMSGSRYATPFATDHNPVRVVLTIPGE
jgi:endonuclease/exonuclease/phosphatase family metal-dependent hydrolase